MSIQKKDFIEIDFTAKVKDGEVFDSNVKSELEKLHAGHDHEIEAKPFILCIGESMFLPAIDAFLIGKEVGKEYEIELQPENAFGKRTTQLVYTMPMKIFREKNVNPFPGLTLNFDGRVGKILTVSGGRVTVDFNHFLAGKPVAYQIKVKRKVDDLNEKIDSLNEFFFRKKFKFKVEGKNLTL